MPNSKNHLQAAKKHVNGDRNGYEPYATRGLQNGHIKNGVFPAPRGGLGMLSYAPASEHDMWGCANRKPAASSVKKPRVSHAIYALQFNPDPPAELLDGMKYIIALVSAEHLSIVKISADGATTVPLRVFVVPDQTPDAKTKEKEDLYTVQWVKDPINSTKWSTVCFAGSSGVIRIVELLLVPQRTAFLRGHAAAVNELAYCKEQPAFLLSGSKDYMIRLWSIKYLTCLALFGGAQGHKAEVISLDMHSSGQFFVSGSYDSCVKIWSLFSNDNKQLLDTVRVHAIATDPLPCTVPAPVFSATDIHDLQIDCVRWMLRDSREYIVASKASDETILIWIPVLPRGVRVPGIGTEWQLCHTINLKNNKFWFVKFALLQEPFFTLAIGDDTGLIKLYDLSAIANKQKHSFNSVRTNRNRNTPPNKAVVRSMGFSVDGALMIGGSDDGMCHIFRRGEKNPGPEETVVKQECMDVSEDND